MNGDHTFDDIQDGDVGSDYLESANEDARIGNLIDYAVFTLKLLR